MTPSSRSFASSSTFIGSGEVVVICIWMVSPEVVYEK